MMPEVGSLPDPAIDVPEAGHDKVIETGTNALETTMQVQRTESLDGTSDQLQALEPLTEDLARTLTCPICLDYMYKARQLQCGHLFCADCVIRMLGLPKVRCAMCKTKTSKRMVRVAPLPFSAMIRGLRVLQRVLAEANSASSMPVIIPRDGFSTSIAEAVRRHRSEQEAYEQEVASNVANVTSGGEGPGKASLLVRKKRPGVTESEGASQKSKKSRVGRRASKETLLEGHICILCPIVEHAAQANSEGTLGKLMMIVREDPWAEERWVHEKCAIFSEDVYEVNGEMDNVNRVLCRTAETRCSWEACNRVKATVKCAHSDCDRRYHYKCALSSGCVCIEDGYRTFCPDHKYEAPQINEADFLKLLSDASEPYSMRHEDRCYLCNTGGRLLMCDSCERVTHPACVGLRAIPLGDWHCSVCTGTHNAHDVKPKLVPTYTQTQTQTQTCTFVRPSLHTTGTGMTTDRTSSGDRLGRRDGGDELDSERMVGGRSCIGSATGGGKRARVSDGGRRIILSHTGLDDAQKELFLQLTKARRVTVKDDIGSRVTHMVVGCEKDGKPTRTMKLCKAVALKLPVVCWGWVEACASIMDADSDLPDMEEFIHPVTRKPSDEGVFEGMTFSFSCFSGDKQKREELAELVKMGGGTVLQRDVSGKGDTPDAVYVQNEEVNRRRSRDSKSRFDPPRGASVVGRTWIFDRIMQRRDQPASN